jgi:hypothetical protein
VPRGSSNSTTMASLLTLTFADSTPAQCIRQAGSSTTEEGSLSPLPSRSPWSRNPLWPPLSSDVPTVYPLRDSCAARLCTPNFGEPYR